MYKTNDSCTDAAQYCCCCCYCLYIQFAVSDCARSSFPKCSSNVFEWAYGIQVYYGIFCIENAIYKIDDLCTETHKRIKRHYNQWVKTFKRFFYHTYIVLNIMKLT